MRKHLLTATLSLLLAAQVSLAQTVTRGPYLQMATPTSITLRWRTDIATNSQVSYARPGDSALIEAEFVSTTEHEIVLTGLAPATLYNYSVGTTTASLSGGNPGMGGDGQHFFTTPPLTGADKTTRIWVIGDSGTATSNAVAVRDAYTTYMGNIAADVWLTVGDNAYPNGTNAEYQVAFFDMYRDLLRRTPVWPIVGTHDAVDIVNSPPGAFTEAFTFPSAGEAGGVASGSEKYYSFNYGNIHFISLDSVLTDLSPDGEMMTWLANDLANNTQLWTIAYWHLPPYKTSYQAAPALMRQNALPLLEARGVDLVLSGDVHTYWRSPLLDGFYGTPATFNSSVIVDDGNGVDEAYCEEEEEEEEECDGAYVKPGGSGTPHEGAVYAIVGTSGKIGYALNHPATKVSLSSLGSMVLEVTGNRLDARFLDGSGAIQDRFSIIKGPDVFAPFVTQAESGGHTTVYLSFSEELDEATAETIANYTFDSALSNTVVRTASLQEDERTVMLTTTLLDRSKLHGITVNNVEDEAGNPITDSPTVYFNQGDLGTYPVSLDVKPGDGTNQVSPDLNLVTPVAILGTNVFDVAQVNPATVKLGIDEAPINGSPTFSDINADTHTDFVAGFQNNLTGMACDDTEVTLVGETIGGTPFTGTDYILTPECDSGTCHP